MVQGKDQIRKFLFFSSAISSLYSWEESLPAESSKMAFAVLADGVIKQNNGGHVFRERVLQCW